jgi:hypothetical protein
LLLKSDHASITSKMDINFMEVMQNGHVTPPPFEW